MKKKSIILTSLLSILLVSFTIVSKNENSPSKESKVAELNQNQPIQEVKIGNQIWMKKNLDVAKFRNGDVIPQAKTNIEWEKAGENGQPAWCYYDNDPANGTKYGRLYNWHAVNDPRGLAPEGYHIPTLDDWTILTDYLGPNPEEKLKSTVGWNNSGLNLGDKTGNGTNSSGFSAVPSGYRTPNGPFYSKGGFGIWWSSSTPEEDYGSLTAEAKYLTNDKRYLVDGYRNLSEGLSVRCVKN